MADSSLIYPSERQDLTEWRKSFKLVQEKFGILPQAECQLIGFKNYPLLER